MKAEIPRSARQLLARQPAPDEHPSADLLAGFAEQALSAAEKQRVTTHLTACAECREVVFLASAAAGDDQPAMEKQREVAPGRRKWTTWKWLAPALAAVVLVGIVIVNLPSTLSPSRQAPGSTILRNRVSIPPQTEANNGGRNELAPSTPALSASPSEARVAQAKKATATRRTLHPEGPRPPLRAGTVASNRSAAPVGPQSPPVMTAELASAPPPPPMPKSVTPESAVVMQSADAGKPAAKAAPVPSVAMQSANAAAPAPSPATQKAAKDASGAGVGGAKGGVLASVMTRPPALASSMPHWRITADGHLERGSAYGDWTRVLAEQPVTFRTVAVSGRDVWAGGSDGALFHSSDGGNAWSQVKLLADGQAEHAAVNSIRFDSPSEGRVSTDEGAIWSTSDGGKTWSKQ